MSGIPAWAVKGAQVVCVDARWTNILGIPELVERATYVIERVTVETSHWDGTQPVVYLVGKHRWFEKHGGIRGFRISRFRPLVSTKTMAEDVALIKSHLKAPPRSATKRRAPAEVSDV